MYPGKSIRNINLNCKKERPKSYSTISVFNINFIFKVCNVCNNNIGYA